MSDIIQVCARCGRVKPIDGCIFCGGGYCLLEAGPDYEPHDERLVERWTEDGNPNDPEAK